MIATHLRNVITQLSIKPVACIKTDEPQKLRKNLYKAAKRRGYRWRFATDKTKVYVKVNE